MSTSLTGGCLCGGVRYRVDAAPTDLNDCHCVDCRRSSGAPYVTWGTVSCDKLQVTDGRLRQVLHAGRIRSWAACCGTQLFFHTDAEADTVDVTIASLDDPAPFPPQCAIWTEDRLPWVRLDERLPAHPRGSGA
jgi:hypothetical protein